MASPLKHRTLSGALINEIRQAILSGHYPAGSQLRQDALAETYGVSRIPVREVLFQLEAEGLVRILPQKGAVVSELSVAEINDVFELRALLEPRLFLDSAPQLTADDFQRLEETQARYVKAISLGEVGQYGVLNAELHMAMYHRADMPRTQQIVASLLQTSDRYTRVQLSTEEAMNRAMQEHADIIRLCRDAKWTDAATLLTSHIIDVRKDLIDVLATRAI
jgi:DNA-binding GntR family transcriptional regulator